MGLQAEFTSFTLDNLGRGLANLLEEALVSAGVAVPGLGQPPIDARPFDVIVLGGGTFGSALAQHLLFVDRTHSRRILVLEGGPFVLPEHVQNLPTLGFGLPALVQPWVPAPPNGPNPVGLFICVGGRSLAWGGWSPEPLQEEIGADWPPAVQTDLRGPVVIDGQAGQPGYFAQAADQLGTEDTNDYIHGSFHNALRAQLRAGLAAATAGTVASNLPFAALPDPLPVRNLGVNPSAGALRQLLGLPAGNATPAGQLLEEAKLEAPLAVQSRTGAGLLPINKFSAVPLLIAAARSEADATYPYDQFKRLMVVPGWHVQELTTETLPDNSVRVTGVWVAQGTSAQVARRQFVPLAGDGVVVLALGTIESTRLALQTFQDSLSWRAAQRMGRNLLAHLRSNLTIRVPRNAIPNMPNVPQAAPGVAQQSLTEVSALFVKGRSMVGGRDRYFHLQITASGANAGGRNSEAQLFRKVPDLDDLQTLGLSNDTHVVLTLRGIGEMSPQNPDSRVTRDNTVLDFDRPRAAVAIGNAKAYAESVAAGTQPPGVSTETQVDAAVWEEMDRLADEVAVMFGGGGAFQILANNGDTIDIPAGANAALLGQRYPHVQRRDGLGTTHHEAGTLWMGDDVATSVTTGFGQIHDTRNCFCAGPAVLPSLASPNPMLADMALARRTGDFLARRLAGQPDPAVLVTPAPFAGDGPGWQVLFDGSVSSFRRWSYVGPRDGADNQPPSGFRLVDGQIVTVGSNGIGLLYHPQTFANFTLKLEFRVFDRAANSGVFVRFRDPVKPLPGPVQARADADLRAFGNNRAWTAVHSGFEVQIDDVAAGDPRVDFYGIRPEPSGLSKNRTGAIYKIPAGDLISGSGQVDRQDQQYDRNAAPGLRLPASWDDPSAWYQYQITVNGDTYEVELGRVGEALMRTTRFVNADPIRGVAPSAPDPDTGFIGLQAYSNARVAFRHVQVRALP